jgi:hypothetical protein
MLNNLSGLHMNKFEELLGYISDIRDIKTRTSTTCLGIFLKKLKSGLDNKILGTLFNLTKSQVSSFYIYFYAPIKYLENNVILKWKINTDL